MMVQGASAEANNSDGRTPLHIAVQNGHVKTVKLLVEHMGFVFRLRSHLCWSSRTLNPQLHNLFIIVASRLLDFETAKTARQTSCTDSTRLYGVKLRRSKAVDPKSSPPASERGIRKPASVHTQENQ